MHQLAQHPVMDPDQWIQTATAPRHPYRFRTREGRQVAGPCMPPWPGAVSIQGPRTSTGLVPAVETNSDIPKSAHEDGDPTMAEAGSPSSEKENQPPCKREGTEPRVAAGPDFMEISRNYRMRPVRVAHLGAAKPRPTRTGLVIRV